MNAKTIRSLIVLLAAGAAAYGFFHFRPRSSQNDRSSASPAASVPPGGNESKISAAPVAKTPETPAAPSASEPVAPAQEDQTVVDRVGVPKRRVFTPEQQAELDRLRELTGEAEMQIQEAIRQQSVARAAAMGEPSIRPLVESLRTARRDLEAFTRSHAERSAAEKRFSEAQREFNRLQDRVATLDRHHSDHLPGAGSKLSESCEWCRRDADRIRAKDTSMEQTLTAEMNQLKIEIQAVDKDFREARNRMATVRREMFASGEGQVFQDRVAQAQRALDGVVSAAPAVADWRRQESGARERQQALFKDYQAIYRQGRLVEATVASGVQVDGLEKKAQ